MATDFRDPTVKEAKQSEFLVQQSVPWFLVERIGVYSEENAWKVRNVIEDAEHKPTIETIDEWYY